jgi:hypothetical protein
MRDIDPIDPRDRTELIVEVMIIGAAENRISRPLV